MATDIREEIDKALVVSLQASTLIQLVTRDYVSVDYDTGVIEGISYLEMPAIVVNTGNEADYVEIPGGKTRATYSPEIVGYVHDEDAYYTELNKLVAETKKMLFADRRLMYNSACIGVVNGIAELTTDRGQLSPYALFAMTLEVLFDYETVTGGEITT